mgnify:CR=1 FL=1
MLALLNNYNNEAHRTTIMKKLLQAALAVSVSLACMPAMADKNKDDSTIFTSDTFKAMELRSIGPAYMSGRIADIAIDQNNPSTWYTAVGSGGVWKTTNAGTTWTPIFDKQAVYSIGDVTIAPSN